MVRSSLRYQLRDQVQAVGVYYIIYLSIALLTIMWVRISPNSAGDLGGMEMSTTIFLFVMGLVSFRETFHMMLQNGVSRRTLLISRLLTVVILCVTMATIDMTLTGASRALAGPDGRLEVYSLYDLIYPQAMARMNGFGRWITNWALMATQSILVTCLGYCITLAYYRMNKLTKWVVSVGVPVLFMFGMTRGNVQALGRGISVVLGVERQLPFLAVLTFLALAAVISGCSWLLLRRAAVR